MIVHSLKRALEYKKKEYGRAYDVDNERGYFSTVYRDILDAIVSWHSQTVDLISFKYWRIENLRKKDGTLRKPKAYFRTEITAKGNFVLNWYPTDGSFFREKGDWSYWDDQWPAGSTTLPFNRILMIHDFEYLYHKHHDKSFDQSDDYLLQALQDVIREIYTFLNNFIEVIKLEELYLEYAEGARFSDKKLIGCRIRNVSDVRKESVERSRKEWLHKTFDNILVISPEQFLETFKEAGMKFATTAKLISVTSKKKVTSATVKSTVLQLYNQHPDIYDRVLSAPPPGAQPRENKVVRIY